MSNSTQQKTCDKKLKTAELKLQKIISKINTLHLKDSIVSQINLPPRKVKLNFSGIFRGKMYYLFCVLFVLTVCYGAFWIYTQVTSQSCLLAVPSALQPLFRPPEDCSKCIGIKDVTRVANIMPQEFEDKFAYSTTPVIIVDAMDGWKAVREFSFNFFADFYQNTRMGKQINDCFYFAYKSGLNSLSEVFSMDEKRANLTGDPWYVGWSTCYDEETKKLRSYYDRPYFLPRTAESDMVDWIFMGGPGQGAHMHVDSVRHMSWQAQIRGRKQWELAPPPECLYQCSWINFTVHPGEILVVDTNRWYHRTNVLPGDISITIGAEYD